MTHSLEGREEGGVAVKLIKIILGKDDIQNVDTFRDILYYHIQQVKEVGLHYAVKEQRDNEFVYFNCQFWPVFEHTMETHEGYRRSVSHAVAEYIVTCKEEEVLKEILAGEFHYVLEEDQNRILPFVYSLLQDNEYGEKIDSLHKDRVNDQIAEKVIDYLWLEHTLTIDGFVRFRLKEQWEQWRQLIEHAVEEYLADKEYKEFIRLVRYSLCAQDPKTKRMHILHIDDRNIQLFNENWQQVALENPEHFTFLERRPNTNYEDMLLGALIYMAPQQLIIHTDQENHHIIYTLKRIFEQRVEICSRCLDCHTKFSQSIDYNV
jgi:putative sporulation protein YtxC